MNKSFFFFLFSLLLLFQGSSQSLFSLQQNLTQSLSCCFGKPIIVNGNNLFIGTSNNNYAFLYSINGGNYSSSHVFSAPTKGSYGSLDIEGTMCVIADFYAQLVYPYSFYGSAWNQQKTITGNDTQPGDFFGYSISLNSNGNLLAVGAPYKNSYNGTLYIFSYNGSVWTQQAEIQSPFPSGFQFGNTVLFVNNMIIASAPYAGIGYVGVFAPSANSWTRQQNLLSNVSSNAEFGSTLAFDGNTLAVGAVNDSVGGVSSLGSVSLYTNNGGTWNFLTKIYPTSNYSGSSTPYVGISISIYGNTLVMGSINLELAFVFTFSGSTWSQTQVISDPNSSFSLFGIAVFLNLDTLYVSAPGYNSGIVYIFSPQITTGQATTSLEVITGFQTSSFQTGSMQTSESSNVSSGKVIAIMNSIIISFLTLFLIFLF